MDVEQGGEQQQSVKRRKSKKKSSTSKSVTDDAGKNRRLSSLLRPGDKIYNKNGGLKFTVKKNPAKKRKTCRHKKS
jgi:hypothetical protein